MTFDFRSTATAATAAAALLALALPASALTVNHTPGGSDSNPWGPYGHRGVTTNDPAYTGKAGTFSLQADGLGEFMAWCLDLDNFLDLPGDYTITTNPYTDNPLSSTQMNDLQSLFDNNFSGLDMTENNTSAAWQQALWEIVYEDGGSYDVAGGNFTAKTNTAANGLANTWLGNLGSTTKMYNLTFLESDADSQNLVTVSEVPLPASGLLLLGALSGLGLISATRRRTATTA